MLEKKHCSQLDHKIIKIKKKPKSVLFLPVPAPPTGSAAEDLGSPARPAACAGCWLCSEAPCCIQWCEPFHRRPHPSTWTNGSSAETLLQITNSDQSLTIKPGWARISNLAVKQHETTVFLQPLCPVVRHCTDTGKIKNNLDLPERSVTTLWIKYQDSEQSKTLKAE